MTLYEVLLGQIENLVLRSQIITILWYYSLTTEGDKRQRQEDREDKGRAIDKGKVPLTHTITPSKDYFTTVKTGVLMSESFPHHRRTQEKIGINVTFPTACPYYQ